MHAHAFATLKHLTHTGFTSGEAIGAALGVSRATVWQAIRQLEELGVEVQKVRRQGYRLARPHDALDAGAVTRALGDAAASYTVATVDMCESTSTAILADDEIPTPGARVLAAELQTAGRGRRGRGWVSGLGTSLTFSVLRRFDGGMATLSGLSLAVGLAVARALEELGAQGVRLKWPNDVLLALPPATDQGVGHAKLGGILIELAGDALGPTRAVIGIGLNVRLPAEARARAGQPVSDLLDAGLAVARNRVLAAVLRHLHWTIDVFNREGFEALRAQWDASHAYQDCEVVLLHDGRVEKTGTVIGADTGGGLRVRTARGIETVVSGELSLRPLDSAGSASSAPA